MKHASNSPERTHGVGRAECVKSVTCMARRASPKQAKVQSVKGSHQTFAPFALLGCTKEEKGGRVRERERETDRQTDRQREWGGEREHCWGV